MPPKRRCAKPPQDPPASKRRGGVSEATDTQIIKKLKECAEEQRNHIAYLNKFLVSLEPRFKRLRLHVQYQLKVENMRFLVRNLTEEQIKEYEKKITGYNRQEIMEKMIIDEMEKQEEKLEKIVQNVVKYKKLRLQDAEEIMEIEPRRYGPYEQELKDALLNIPATFRDDAEMESVPKFQKKDLDQIEWPEVNHDWRKYSIHWNSEFEEAAECRNLNEKIDELKEKLAEALSVYEQAQTKKDNIKLYDENRNCPIHGKKIRDAERTELSEQLEQVIHKSFEKRASLESLKAKKRLLETSKKEREDLVKSIQEEVNSESLKCSVCFESLTNGEQSLRCPQQFGSCGHTVCATCMAQFKGRRSPYHWTCHQCRKPSDKVTTNWALMQLIKEIPGQPQRVVVDAPAAVPIVPAPWRLEERREANENPWRGRIINFFDDDDIDRLLLEFLGPDDLEDPAPEAPPRPREWAPMIPDHLRRDPMPMGRAFRRGVPARDPEDLAPVAPAEAPVVRRGRAHLLRSPPRPAAQDPPADRAPAAHGVLAQLLRGPQRPAAQVPPADRAPAVRRHLLPRNPPRPPAHGVLAQLLQRTPPRQAAQAPPEERNPRNRLRPRADIPVVPAPAIRRQGAPAGRPAPEAPAPEAPAPVVPARRQQTPGRLARRRRNQ